MAFKVTFPANVSTVTVSGLFQWDYGQVLEIESADIGSEIVEVHFSCEGMSEAIVRSCSFSNGVGTVTIPDQCLEQASTMTAWIYRINGTTGYTFKTITLPITPRTRPSKAREIPTEFSDKYTELITEINEAVDNLENGNIAVPKAAHATNANYAATAGNASSANYATSAGIATKASALELPAGYTEAEGVYGTELPSGLYVLRVSIYEQDTFQYTFHTVIGVFAVTNASNVFLGESPDGRNKFMLRVYDNMVTVWIFDETQYVNIEETQGFTCTMMYKKICS